MHLIDTPNAVAVEPVASPAGTPGYFDESGPNPTEFSADWGNAVQGELTAMVVGLGGVPTKGTNNQIWTLLALRVVSDAGVLDAPSAMTLKIGPANATKVEIADTGVTTEVQGPLDAVEGTTTDALDARTATTLTIGASTATKVEVADTGVETEVQGPLDAVEGVTTDSVDARTATTLALGASTATKVEIADAGVETEVQGPMTVVGAFQAPVDVADEVEDTVPNDEITSNVYHGRFKTKSLTTAALGTYAFLIKSDKSALGDIVDVNIEFYAGAGMPVVRAVAANGQIACGFTNVHPTDALNAAIYGSFSITKKSV